MCDSCFPFWILTIVGKRKEENIPKQAKTSFKNWRCRLQGWGGPRKMRCELTVSLPGLHFIVSCYRQHIPFTGTLLQGECSSEYFVAQLWISESHHEETVVLCWSPCSAMHIKTLQHLMVMSTTRSLGQLLQTVHMLNRRESSINKNQNDAHDHTVDNTPTLPSAARLLTWQVFAYYLV